MRHTSTELGRKEADDAGGVTKVTPTVTRWEKQRMKDPSPPRDISM